jgi:hypothetical protein
MIRYLHSQCLLAVGDLAQQMLRGGAFAVGPTDRRCPSAAGLALGQAASVSFSFSFLPSHR